MSEPQDQPRAAASVILLREGDQGAEVYLLRRHRKAKFMASSYVFPGGIADEGESDARFTAIRELFEESGVLLATGSTSAEQRCDWRNALNTDKADFGETLGDLSPKVDSLHYFSHWITPSVEERRYSAKFYVAVLPEGQVASPDNKETVDELWVTPAEALERSAELQLPPPQLRTFLELLEPATRGIQGILEAASQRSETIVPFLPRAYAAPTGLALLMPWDPLYESAGQGASHSIAAGHPLAWGPSRFLLRDGTWQLVCAPESVA